MQLFHMSVLAAYLRPCTRSEIIKVTTILWVPSIQHLVGTLCKPNALSFVLWY